MLANLLPGIRDIRTPLATGYLWLLALWLWIPSHFKHVAPTTGVPGDLTSLVHYASRAGVAVAVSFAAYLVGVLSKSLNAPLVRLGTLSFYVPTLIRWRGYRTGWIISNVWHRLRGRIWQPSAGTPDPPGRLPLDLGIGFWDFLRPPSFYIVPESMSEPERDGLERDFFEKGDIVTAQLSRSGLYSLQDFSRRTVDEGKIKVDRQTRYYSYLLREVPRLGNALVGKETELYSVYDRLISEYEFRIGIGAPMIALTITLAVRWNLWWLLMLLPVLVLLGTGSQQRMAAGDLLADAVRLKRIDVALPRAIVPESTRPSADQSDHADGDSWALATKMFDASTDQTQTKTLDDL